MRVYLLLFLEGFFAFASPCILPMLPVYLIYLAGDKTRGTKQLLINTLGFILGFSIIFMALGATATAFGRLLQEHKADLMRYSGGFILLLGLYYLASGSGKFSLERFLPSRKSDKTLKPPKELHFFSSLLFGMAFCTGWTPCLATWLSAALTMSANAETWVTGVGMLFVFSLGLGLPFLIFALGIGKLRGTLRFLQQKTPQIRAVSGILLILLGIFMLSGHFQTYLGWFL